MATPYVMLHLGSTESTQDDARRAFSGVPVVAAASSQKSGRGRANEQNWENAPRALAVSLAFAPQWPIEAWSRLALVAGLAAIDLLPSGFSLKWPNDIMRSGNKVAGILVESDSRVAVAGLGLNLWWPDPPPGYGAVWDDDPGEHRYLDLAEIWASRFLARVDVPSDRWGRQEYRAVCGTLGRTVSWKPGGEGLAIDISPSGSLVVETAEGSVDLASGEVSEVRPQSYRGGCSGMAGQSWKACGPGCWA